MSTNPPSDVQPIRTIIKEEEMPNVNASTTTSTLGNSTSSSPTTTNCKQEEQLSDHDDASLALSSMNKTLLDQHDTLLGMAQLATTMPVDHVSDSDNDDDEFSNSTVNRVSDLYSLLRDEDSDHEGSGQISSLPPQSSSSSTTTGTNTPTMTNNITNHLAKRARQQAAAEASSSSTNTSSTTNTTVTPKKRPVRKVKVKDESDDEEIADAGAMEIGEDDEYVADVMEEDDEERAMASAKKRNSKRRQERNSPNLASSGVAASGASTSNGTSAAQTEEDEVVSEDDLVHCVVCKRSSLEVNFKKNYTINTNNYKTYCDTFPYQSDQIPKPRDGESLSVCSTCYNKQWRFARGQYDPFKNRVVNKREGLKKPLKLKDSPRMKNGGEEDSSTPSLGQTPTLGRADSSESPSVVDVVKKRKVTKRRSVSSTSTEDNTLNASMNESVNDSVGEETPKKKVKRATKAKKAPLPIPPSNEVPTIMSPIPSTSAAAVAANMSSSIPISTLIPGTVTIANAVSSIPTTSAIPSPSPNKRGRKSKNPPNNLGVVSGAPASSYKKDGASSPPPVINNTALLISYLKRVNGTSDEIYTTKIVTQQCPETIEQLRDVVMERLVQKKGDLFAFDRACCNSVDRFNNSIKVEVDEFFFRDVKLNNNDSLCIYLNDKQQ